MIIDPQEAIAGALTGGAIGEVLGNRFASAELVTSANLFSPDGITHCIGDATKASLFVANGLLLGDTRTADKGQGSPHCYDVYALGAWRYSHQHFNSKPSDFVLRKFWLLDHPELYSSYKPSCHVTPLLRVSPHALYEARFINHTVNKAVTCIGEYNELYSAAVILIAILITVIRKPNNPLSSIIDKLLRVIPNNNMWASPRLQFMLYNLLDGREPCDSAITEDEVLATAIYCCMTANGFENIILQALNTKGDNTAVAYIAGTLAGAIFGDTAIPQPMKRSVTQIDIIREIANDLASGARLSFGAPETPEQKRWGERYCR